LREDHLKKEMVDGEVTTGRRTDAESRHPQNTRWTRTTKRITRWFSVYECVISHLATTACTTVSPPIR